jgi:hypothetical protein
LKTLPRHQQVPTDDEHQYLCRRRSCRGWFTAQCMEYDPDVGMHCPYCIWWDRSSRWDAFHRDARP